MEAFESLLSDGPHVQAVLFEGIGKFSENRVRVNSGEGKNGLG